MKFLRHVSFFFLTFFILALLYQDANAQERISTPLKGGSKGLTPVVGNYNTKAALERPLNVTDNQINFVILDSLANAFSYFTQQQQPFGFYPGSGKGILYTVKRGYNLATAASNTLNDLFLYTSTDWGNTWAPPVQIYNEKSFSGNWARYPSVYCFKADAADENSLSFIFTSPITNGTGWQGFMDGIYQPAGTDAPFFIKNADTKINGKSFGWGSDSKIFGIGTATADAMYFAIGGVLPPTGLPFSDNSNVAYRQTRDYGTFNYIIPAQWGSDRFVPQVASGSNTDSLKSSSIISLKYEGNTMYSAVEGAFNASEFPKYFLPAVSKSLDTGKTWSEFEIFPYSLIENYAKKLGLSSNGLPDTLVIYARDFVVLPNGDYSYLVYFKEAYRDAVTNPHFNGLAELYKAGGAFGVRPIANASGSWLNYWDMTPGILNDTLNNQMPFEVNLARSVDGTKLLAKWVDVDSVKDQTSGAFMYYTQNIYVAVREIGSDAWSLSKNITQSDMPNHVTWVPDLIPNDLKNIPVLKVESIPKSTDATLNAQLLTAYTLNPQPQYVKIGHFDADILLDVKENNNSTTESFEIMGIYPNPSDNQSHFDLSLPKSGNVVIGLFDVLGNKVLNVFSGNLSNGLSSLNVNTASLTSGAYLLSVSFDGKKISKLINVLH